MTADGENDQIPYDSVYSVLLPVGSRLRVRKIGSPELKIALFVGFVCNAAILFWRDDHDSPSARACSSIASAGWRHTGHVLPGPFKYHIFSGNLVCVTN